MQEFKKKEENFKRNKRREEIINVRGSFNKSLEKYRKTNYFV